MVQNNVVHSWGSGVASESAEKRDLFGSCSKNYQTLSKLNKENMIPCKLVLS